jgi:hypothetical protein
MGRNTERKQNEGCKRREEGRTIQRKVKRNK